MPGTRHVSRQTIVSSTRPASHHHVHLPATVQGSNAIEYPGGTGLPGPGGARRGRLQT